MGFRVQDVTFSDVLVHPVFNDLGGSVVAEHVVDGRRQFKGSLVTVALHGLNPFGVYHAATEYPAGFVLKVPDPGPGRVGTVPKKLPRVPAGQGAHGGDHAAVVLHVVVAIEDVVLPGVLVLGGHHYLTEPAAELRTGVDAEILTGVGISAPSSVHLGQVLHGFPVPFVQRCQNSCSVSSRLTAEDPVHGSGPCIATGGVGTCLLALAGGGPGQVLAQMLDDEVILGSLVLGCRQLHGLVQQVYKVGEGVPEETADTHGDVYTGMAQLFSWYDLDPQYSAALRLPYRPNTQKVQNLGDIISMGAHGRRSPHDHTHHLRVGPFLREVFLQQGL